MRRTDLYKVDGHSVSSVTETMGSCGLHDFSAVDPQVLEYARERGVKVHAGCHDIRMGHMVAADEPDAEVRGYLEAFEDFMLITGFETVYSEHVVVSKQYRYAGTLDLAGYFHNLKVPSDRIFVIDTKAVAVISLATAVQTAGYALALSEQTGLVNIGRAVVNLRPTGKYNLDFYQHGKRDLARWLACVQVHQMRVEFGLATINH